MEEKERYEWNSRFDEAIKDNKTGDIVNAVEVLNKQDKRIKELEKKLDNARQKDIIIRQNCRQGYIKDLEEMNNLREENQQLKQQLSEKDKIIQMQQNIKRFDIGEMLTENIKLKQQLNDLPKKIVEEIKQQIFNHFKVKNIEEYEKLSLIDSLFTADTVIEILDTILKKYGGEENGKSNM